MKFWPSLSTKTTMTEFYPFHIAAPHPYANIAMYKPIPPYKTGLCISAHTISSQTATQPGPTAPIYHINLSPRLVIAGHNKSRGHNCSRLILYLYYIT